MGDTDRTPAISFPFLYSETSRLVDLQTTLRNAITDLAQDPDFRLPQCVNLLCYIHQNAFSIRVHQ